MPLDPNSVVIWYWFNVQHCSFISYDDHIIMRALAQYKQSKLGCILQTMEKYISFSMDHLVFLDSAQFLPASLCKLVENLAAEGLPNSNMPKLT